MKTIRAAVALFLVAVFLAGYANATTSSVNPNVPAQNSPLSSSVLRGNFAAAQNDLNTLFGIDTLTSNQLLGTVNAGMAGGLNLPSCAAGALSWTPGTGFGCNSINGLVSPITQSLIFTGIDSFNLNAVNLPTKQVGTVLQVGNADTVASRIESDAFGAAAYFTGVRLDGTNAAPTTLQNLDEISGINAWGYNGSSIVGPRASVREFASQNWTGSAQGTRLDIATTLNNTTTLSPVCGFENDGGVTCPPTVTGGDLGAGRINAAGLFVNGVAVSTGNSALSALTAATATNSIENTSNGQTWNWDGLTTQSALKITSTSLTSGKLLDVENVSGLNSTGYAGYFSTLTTGPGYALAATITGASNTGYAGYFTNSSIGTAYGLYSSESGAANTGYAGYFANTSTGGYAVYISGTIGIAGNGFSVPNTPALSTATFTPDFSTSNHFKFVLVHASCPCTVANPLNVVPGQSGVIKVTQSSTGSDAVTWGSEFKFAGATAPTLSTGASASDYFGYWVDDSTHIVIGAGVLNAH
jgi:hypothetical protein